MAANRNCLFCSERFDAKLARKLFCSDVCRVRYNREAKLRCFYCGELATTRDHVFPHAARTNGSKRVFAGQETVNACRECNSLMGARNSHYVEDRIQDLISSLMKRYQLDKAIPDWDDDELDELGRGLRQSISSQIHRRQRAIERVIYAREVWRRVVLAAEVDEELNRPQTRS